MALFIVPVPIGNLKDITLRAIETLQNADFIIVEDTRHSLKLLNHLGISKKLHSYYKPREEEKAEKILDLLEKGDGAIITDSGTPLISDPGEILVRKAVKRGIAIVSLPGPTAFVPALTNSCLSSDGFVFAGFSPRKEGKLKARLKNLKNLDMTLVFYESPNRVESFLETAASIFGEREFSISRELTKRNEQVVRGNLKEYKKILEDVPSRGEFVIVIAGSSGNTDEKKPELNSLEDIYSYFKEKHGISRNRIKQILMKRKEVNQR